MKYETTSQALEALKTLQETLGAYHHVMGVTDFDASTAAPKGSHQGRGKVMGILSRVTYDLIADPQNDEMLKVLEGDLDNLTQQQKREVEVLIPRVTPCTSLPKATSTAWGLATASWANTPPTAIAV